MIKKESSITISGESFVALHKAMVFVGELLKKTEGDPLATKDYKEILTNAQEFIQENKEEQKALYALQCAVFGDETGYGEER